jgi:hypothetical protein
MNYILYLCIYNSRPTIENKLIKTPLSLKHPSDGVDLIEGILLYNDRSL